MGTRLWAISASLDKKILEEKNKEEEKLLNDAMDELAEIASYELIDNGQASYAGEY